MIAFQLIPLFSKGNIKSKLAIKGHIKRTEDQSVITTYKKNQKSEDEKITLQEKIANLVGHQTTAMIEKHYGHLASSVTDKATQGFAELLERRVI